MATGIPYTYLVGWPTHNKWYYGVRYASDAHPGDLWTSYKTSSKHVKAFVEQFGDPEIRQVRKVFDSSEKARIWENKVLARLGVVRDSRWLNKTDNISIEPVFGDAHPMKRPEVPCRGDAHPMKRPESRARASQLWRANNPMFNPEIVKKKVAATSGDNHHMKRPEVAQKVTGDQHYLKKNAIMLEAHRKYMRENNPMKPGHVYPKVECAFCHGLFGKNVIAQHIKKSHTI